MILLFVFVGLAVGSPLARHQYRLAVATLSAVLETDDRPLWHARLGSARARLGHHRDALTAFAAGMGSPWYERAGWRDHANVLRAVGRCSEAASLRETFEPTVSDPAALWVDIAEDWRACGDVDEAFDAVAAAQARAVDHPMVHAVLADLHRDQGHWTEATYHVEMAVQLDGSDDIRPELSWVEHQLQSGDVEEAERAAERLVVGHMRDPRLFLARTEIWLRTGRLDQAAALASRGPWSDHEDVRVLCRRRLVFDSRGEEARVADVDREGAHRLGTPLRCVR